MTKVAKNVTRKANKEVKGRQKANTKPAAEQPKKSVKLASSRRTEVIKARKGNVPRSKQSEPVQSASPLLMGPWVKLTTAPTMDVVKAIRKGLPRSLVAKVARLYRLKPGEFSELTGILHRQGNQRQGRWRCLTTHESNIIYRSICVLRKAELTIGDLDASIKWMREPFRSLGRNCPLSFMDTSAGFDLVTQILGCVEHDLPV